VGQGSSSAVPQPAIVCVPIVEISLPSQVKEVEQLEAQLEGVAPATQCVVHDE
jgi:hypothetical protein